MASHKSKHGADTRSSKERLMVRVPDPAMLEEWREAAAIEEKRLGLSPGALTVGPWARRVLNAAAAAAKRKANQ